VSEGRGKGDEGLGKGEREGEDGRAPVKSRVSIYLLYSW
jgi:hypothetical protein